MNFSGLSNKIAFGLLAICFFWSLSKVTFRTAIQLDPNIVTIRFAHFNLESGIREALDQVSKDYTKLHPNVRVEQITMPESLYPIWVTTQLVGGTAPDMVMLAPWMGMGPDKVARYFLPLGEYVNQPNPYDDGTNLQGLPWRDTFRDGLNTYPMYQDGLLDYYGVSIYAGLSRIYYNKDLLLKITGSDQTPQTFSEFISLCDKAREYRGFDGKPLIPIAASATNGPALLNALFNSQLQNLDVHQIDPDTSYSKFAEGSNEQFAASYARKKWTTDQPEILSGLNLMHKVGQFMQPGFYQLSRDDASSFFIQQRALMIMGGSYDFAGLVKQSPFEVGVFRLPLPGPDDLEFGKNVLGPEFEGGGATGGAFGVSKNTPHLAETIDFLRFLTSQQENTKFVERSHWLPAVIGVPMAQGMEAFAPVAEGFSGGVSQNPHPFELGAETGRLVGDNFYLLVRDDGGADAFIKALAPEYDEAVIKDISAVYIDQRDASNRMDLSFAAWHALAEQPGSEGEAATLKEASALTSVNSPEDRAYWQRYQVESLAEKKLHR